MALVQGIRKAARLVSRPANCKLPTHTHINTFEAKRSEPYVYYIFIQREGYVGWIRVRRIRHIFCGIP